MQSPVRKMPQPTGLFLSTAILLSLVLSCLPAIAAGPGTPLTGLTLAVPKAITVDSAGNVYVADAASNTVVKIASPGGAQQVVSTLTGFTAPVGVGGAANGDVYASNASSINKETNGATTSVVSGLSFGGPLVLSGTTPTVYFLGGAAMAGPGYAGVQKVSGSSAAAFGSFPVTALWGIAADGNGNVYVADAGAKTVTKLNSSGAASPPVSVAITPSAIAVDSAGANWYVTDLGSGPGLGAVDQVNPSTGAVTPLGSGYVTAVGVALDGQGNLYVLDAGLPPVAPSVYRIQIGGSTVTAPTLTTSAATQVSSLGATLNGSVTPQGQDVTVSFDYGTSNVQGNANYYNNSVSATVGGVVKASAGTTAVSAFVGSLNCNTTYYFRAHGTTTTNGAATSYVDSTTPQTFTTGICTVTLGGSLGTPVATSFVSPASNGGNNGYYGLGLDPSGALDLLQNGTLRQFGNWTTSTNSTTLDTNVIALNTAPKSSEFIDVDANEIWRYEKSFWTSVASCTPNSGCGAAKSVTSSGTNFFYLWEPGKTWLNNESANNPWSKLSFIFSALPIAAATDSKGNLYFSAKSCAAATAPITSPLFTTTPMAVCVTTAGAQGFSVDLADNAYFVVNSGSTQNVSTVDVTGKISVIHDYSTDVRGYTLFGTTADSQYLYVGLLDGSKNVHIDKLPLAGTSSATATMQGQALVSSANGGITVFSGSSTSTASVYGNTVVTAGGNTVQVASNASGTALQLTDSNPVTVKIGNNTYTVTGPGTVTFQADSNGNMGIKATSGTVTLTASNSGQAVVAVKGGTATTCAASTTLSAVGGASAKIGVSSGCLSIPSTSSALARSAHAASTATQLLPGEFVSLDASGNVLFYGVGSASGSGNLVGDPLSLPTTGINGFKDAIVTNLQATTARLTALGGSNPNANMDQRIFQALGVTDTVNQWGGYNVNVGQTTFLVRPLGGITMTLGASDALTSLADGRFNYSLSGYQVTFAPTVPEPFRVVQFAQAIDPTATANLRADGTYHRVVQGGLASGGTEDFLRPAWTTAATTSTNTGLVTQPNGTISYYANGQVQAMNPGVADLSSVIAAAQTYDANASVNVNAFDGTVAVVLHGVTYHLLPDYQIQTPPSNQTGLLWVDSTTGKIVIRCGDGTAQAFTLLP